MIKELEIYHGVVFSRLLRSLSTPISLASLSIGGSSSYIANYKCRQVGIYIKYSSKRLSPWRFTFMQDHQKEIDDLKSRFGEVFVVLVCGTNGVAVLAYGRLKLLLDDHYDSAEWISVSRGKRKMYTVKGKNGDLDYKLGEAEFPRAILEYLEHDQIF